MIRSQLYAQEQRPNCPPPLRIILRWSCHLMTNSVKQTRTMGQEVPKLVGHLTLDEAFGAPGISVRRVCRIGWWKSKYPFFIGILLSFRQSQRWASENGWLRRENVGCSSRSYHQKSSTEAFLYLHRNWNMVYIRSRDLVCLWWLPTFVVSMQGMCQSYTIDRS